MSSDTLKLELHALIDQIDDKALLEDLSKNLKLAVSGSKKSVWDSLTAEQRTALNDALEESDNEAVLIAHEDVLQQFKKWL